MLSLRGCETEFFFCFINLVLFNYSVVVMTGGRDKNQAYSLVLKILGIPLLTTSEGIMVIKLK